ncbi:hypothetical protein JW752_01010 [Candidatus Peregrinibacteria bacterium]|nr:hypothetical protein [Candidatus Peregrinibacteria bacterium]
MSEHLKKHRNFYSLLFLVVVAALVAWLFIRVEQLDAEVAKYSNRLEEHEVRPAVTKVVELEEGDEEVSMEDLAE